MTTELHERLADLASVASPASPPPDLWTRGVRRRRLAAAARTAAVAVLVLMIGAGGWAWHQTGPIEPADTHGAPHLPDRFYTPSPWLDAFDGPPGPLVAVGVAERKTLFHTHQAVYGVTASSGAYGFLELPDAATSLGDDPVLSPDGRVVAYWLLPTPHARMNAGAVGGIGLYDTRTGDTRFFRPSSRYGLTSDVVVWAGSQSVVFDLGRWTSSGGGTSDGYQSYVWRAGRSRPELLEHALPSLMGSTPSGRDGIVIAPPWAVNVDNGARTRLPGLKTAWPAYLDPARRTFASLHGIDRTPTRIQLQRLPRVLQPGRMRVGPARKLTDAPKVAAVLGWLDESHVVALQDLHRPGWAQVRRQVVSIDVRTGGLRVLVRPAADVPILATDLLSAPASAAHAPPRPWDRRWLLGGSLALLLVVGLYLWGATRGRRA